MKKLFCILCNNSHTNAPLANELNTRLVKCKISDETVGKRVADRHGRNHYHQTAKQCAQTNINKN